MSIPRNHHHVSQCHIRLFFNEQEKKIYCYDKELDRYYPKTTTQSLFSEKDGNSRLQGREVDHASLEMDLKTYFEDDFDRHARNILALAENPHAPHESHLESLYYVAGHGLIADTRIPLHKKEVDDILDGGFLEIADRLSRINHYFNPDIQEVAAIGIPLTDKLFVFACSKKLGNTSTGVRMINDNNSPVVVQINQDLFNFAHKTIAAKEEEQLRKIINQYKNR